MTALGHNYLQDCTMVLDGPEDSLGLLFEGCFLPICGCGHLQIILLVIQPLTTVRVV